MYELVLYDTSNFEDFPIGGQLTSIRCFLKYIAQYHTEFAKKILLVGVTTQKGAKELEHVEIAGAVFDFVPVLIRDSDLSNVQSSLRLAYTRALLKNAKIIRKCQKALHYIHTPEAFIAVKAVCPRAKTVVFSHGSFFNMAKGFRFFQNNKLIHWAFHLFLVVLLKSADAVFTLDDASEEQYRKYTDRVIRVENSAELPLEIPVRTSCHDPIRLLFVGRLSRVKRVDEIIRAVKRMEANTTLTVIGDGEERAALEAVAAKENCQDRVQFLGGLSPAEVKQHLQTHDILVMNSVLEGKPMTILEALSYGLPVVTTPVGGIPEMVKQGSNTEFTDGSAQEIAKSICIIERRYATYSQSAVQRAREFDYRNVNKRIFDMLARFSEKQ